MEQLDLGLLCNAPTQRIKDGLNLFKNLDLYRSMMVFGAAYGVRVGIFGMQDLHMQGSCICGRALIWKNGACEMAEAELPRYLESSYVITAQTMSDFSQEIAQALIARKISTITPTKDKLPLILLMNGLAEFVIPTELVRTYEEAARIVQRWKHCVIKPNIGKRGRGVLYADWNDGEMTYESVSDKGALTVQQWDAYCKEFPEYKEFLVQPRLNFHDRHGRAIDFRVLVSKGGLNTWEIVDIYVRYGQNHLVSNVAEGGLLGSGKEFLAGEFDDADHSLYQKLCEIATKVPAAFERVLGDAAESFYGIDVGLDADTMLPYVIEVNPHPGTCFHSYHLAEKRMQYYKYLVENE